MSFTVVSYYTRSTPYEAEVKSLIDSLDRFSIPHDIRGIDSQGSWQSNTLFKAKFLRQIVNEVKTDAVVWLDADAVVEKNPIFFNYIDTDVAFYFRTNGGRVGRIKEPCELLSGTVYLKTNDPVRRLLDMWIAENAKDLNDLEQHNLQKIVNEWRRQGGTMSLLPQQYCRIFDAREDDRVIVHNQASRRFRGA